MAKPNPSKGNETSKEYLNSLNNNSKRQATNCTNEFVNTQDRENKAGENSDAASTTLNVSPKISFAESSVLRSPHQVKIVLRIYSLKSLKRRFFVS